jgi:membrane protease YdiL (CAAX protease family)
MCGLYNQTEKNKVRDAFVFAGFLISFLIMIGTASFLLKKGVIQWPFRRKESILDTYRAVLTYLPFLVFVLTSLVWLKVSEIPILKSFQWKRFSKTFWIAFILSIGYSIFLFITCRFDVKGGGYWPPIILLSLFNAMAEEILYRQIFMDLIQKMTGHKALSNLVQSLFYASLHIPIGGIKFGLYAFLYGLLLGIVKERSQSVIPCILCHFCIDIGNIGLPILILLPVS